MTDQRLRELERRARETGSVEDEAALLLARVRAGDLAQEKLLLAAHCGHPAATTATGFTLPAEDWIKGLVAWGPEQILLVTVEIGLLLLPRWQAAFPDDPFAQKALELAERVCVEGSGKLDDGEAQALARAASDAFSRSKRVPDYSDRFAARIGSFAMWGALALKRGDTEIRWFADMASVVLAKSGIASADVRFRLAARALRSSR